MPGEYVSIAEIVAKKCGWHTKFIPVDHSGTVGTIKENKKVLLALSGGLDSVYMMHSLKDKGYDVIAVHVGGLNKQSSQFEKQFSQKAAARAGVRLITANSTMPKQVYPDNPFKNQFILSVMLDVGIKNGVYRYAIGSDWTTPLKDAAVGYTITDSKEVNEEFWRGIKNRFGQAELLFIPDNVKKYERIQYLWDRKALNDVSSCISPQRFRNSLHEKNEQKYGIKLLEGRCGSCYKCSMEYILLVEAKKIEKNNAYYQHCLDVLATSKTAHRPDLFDKSLPIETRIKNLKNYGS